jgi:hypothetical protein
MRILQKHFLSSLCRRAYLDEMCDAVWKLEEYLQRLFDGKQDLPSETAASSRVISSAIELG